LTEPATTGQETPGWRLASPLSLILDEERHGDQQVEDALFLSFTADLGFFESVVLGVTQATGARITLVGDAVLTAYDPRAVRRAGRSYLAGLAHCRGAFHPKLMVLAGPARVVIALGSGNTTLAGWQANAELWTVLHATPDAAPALLPDLAAWLGGLPERIRFSAVVAAQLGKVARTLDAVTAQASAVASEMRLVTSLHAPILDQLPVGPVDELAVCAPFHDHRAVALRRLVERLQPGRLLVTYQPQHTEMDGAAVSGLVGQVGGEVRLDTGARYRHGKLIEWLAGGQRWALVGSPNLSGAALLRSLADGGNCELAVITPIAATLLPAGAVTPPVTVRGQRLDTPPREEPGPLLLGATRTAEGLHVELAVPLTRPGFLELSAAAAPPETWERIAEVAAGVLEVTAAIAADGGSRLHLVVLDDDQTPHYSSLVFVVDLAQATRRPSSGSAQRAPTTRPDELFADPGLAERFFADLADLRAGLAPGVTAIVTASGAKDHAGVTVPLEPDLNGWERYLDACAGRIGHPLLRFALGLPPLPTDANTSYVELLPAAWDEQFTDDQEAGLVDNDTEIVAAETSTMPAPADLPDLGDADPDVRRRYHRWAERLAASTPRLGLPERMLVIRLLLWATAAHAWPRGDTTWMQLLARALRSLDRGDGLPVDAEPRVGSLAAVAVSVLRAHTPRYERTEDALAYQQTAAAVAHLLPAAQSLYVEEYTKLLDAAFGFAVNPETVLAVADEVVQADPVADAMLALAERGRDAHRHGRQVLHVTGRFHNPLLAALEAVGAAQDAPLVAAWATSDANRWALLIWRKPDLIVIDAAGLVPLWKHYRLAGLVNPRSLALARGLETATAVPHGALRDSFPEALELLTALGIGEVRPPVD
jgi:hypothetical protein